MFVILIAANLEFENKKQLNKEEMIEMLKKEDKTVPKDVQKQVDKYNRWVKTQKDKNHT